MVSFAEWETWVVPLVMLLLVYTSFQTQIQGMIDGMASWASSNANVSELGFKPVAFSLIIFLVLIMGVSLALYLHSGAEAVSWKAIFSKLGVIVILFAMAWMVQQTQSVFSIGMVP